MEPISNTSDLLALDDAQLDDVAGGCFWRRHHGHGGHGHGRGGHGRGGVELTINIIQIEDSTLAAGRDIVVQAG